MRVLVVGAGIAGLSAAIFLEQKGIEVKVIEKTPAAEHRGFVIFLYPNSSLMLKELGIFDAVRADSYPLPLYRIFDAQRRSLIDFRFQDYDEKFGGESLLLERNVLHSNLVKKYGENRIFWETQTKEFKETEEYVEVTYRNGGKEKFDYVIGADGMDSSTRYHYFADDEMASYHSHVWIYWLSKEFTAPKNVEQYIGKDSGFFLFPLADKKCAVYLVTINTEKPEFIDIDLFRKEFANYKKPIPQIVESLTKAKNVYKTTLRHIETKEWYRGRVVLIGDAIHGLSPLTGLGSTIAMQDAYVLAQEISKNPEDYRAALQAFKDRRMPALKKIKKFSRVSTGLASQFSNHGLDKYLRVLTMFTRPFIKMYLDRLIYDLLGQDL